MKSLHKMLIAFALGSLISATALGTFSYLKIDALSTENTQLHLKIKKLNWRHSNLSKIHAGLKEELSSFKDNKAQEYDQTIGALLQAKDNAGIESLYEIGVNALKEKDYPRAYYALTQVEKNNPKFKEIEKHFSNAKKAYEIYQKDVFKNKLTDTYLKAFDHQAHAQYAQAKVNYQRALEMSPQYKDAQSRLETVTRQLDIIQKTKDFEQKKRWLESSYTLGAKNEAQGDYLEAKVIYENILMIAPKYKDTAKRVEKIQALLPPPPEPVITQKLSCFEKGVEFGQCSKTGVDEKSCTRTKLAQYQSDCKDNLDFLKGLQSVGASNAPITLLRGLSSVLSNMSTSNN